MARPKKNNAEYFSHDANASSDEKLIYLESEFGLAGYALFFKMLEALTNADGFELEFSPFKAAILARKFNTDTETFNRFIVAATMQEIRLFRIDNGKIFSDGLKNRLSGLTEKRENDAKRLAEARSKKAELAKNDTKIDIPTIVAATNGIVADTMPQSKVKESKVKERKVYSDIESAPEKKQNSNFDAQKKADFEKIAPPPKISESPAAKKQHDTPESLYNFAVSVFSDQMKINGVIQTYAQNSMIYNPTHFDSALRNWAIYQIEHDNSFFTEKTLYAAVLRWVSNQKRFDNNLNNSKNGNNGNNYPKPKHNGSKLTSRLDEFIEAASQIQPHYAVPSRTIDWDSV